MAASSAMNVAVPGPKPGRPTRSEAERRQKHLLDVAARLFLAEGFSAVSIEQISAETRAGKATIYARYRDKAALFEAALRHLHAELVKDVGDFQPPTDPDVPIDTALQDLACRIMIAILDPKALALGRLAEREMDRFPTLSRAILREFWHDGATRLTGIFRHYADRGDIRLVQDDLLETADAFLTIVWAYARRMAMRDPAVSEAEIAHQASFIVELFLSGIRVDRGSTDKGVGRRPS